MPRTSVSIAKNVMRRAIAEICDPGPTAAEVDELWRHFEGRCAYCDAPIERGSRQAHLDHAAAGGGNHVGNRVLACGPCNGDEKREETWQTFLARKAAGDALDARRRRIVAWFERHPRTAREMSPEVDAARARLEGIVRQFGDACAELRELVGARRERG